MTLRHFLSITLFSFCALAIFVAAGSNLGAQEIVAVYNFDASSESSSDASATTTASDLSTGPGLPSIGPTISGTQGNPAPGFEITFGDFDNGNLTGALAAGDYLSFTVTPDAGTTLTFTELDLDMFKTAAAGATISATLFSDLDGFTLGDEIDNAQLVGGGDSGSFFNRTLDLSSLDPDIDVPVEFRLYLDDGGASNDANDLRLDNLELSAVVSNTVPEPASITLWLLFSAAMTAYGYRLRQKRLPVS